MGRSILSASVGDVSNGRVFRLVLRRLVVVLAVTGAAICLLGLSRGNATEQDRLQPLTDGERLALEIIAARSTVGVSARTCAGLMLGSGFVVEGSLLTNKHVVLDATEVKVGRGSTVETAVITMRSPVADLATGRLLHARVAQPVSFSEEEALVGEPVVLSGHRSRPPSTVTSESVVHTYTDGGPYGIEGDVMLLAATTSLGFSGGPVFDRHGDVVAMLQAYDRTTGLTIAIPTSTLQAELSSAEIAVDSSTCN